MRKRPASSLGFVEPLLPTLVEKPPEGGGWIHEIKFDGYRTQIVAGETLQVFTRRGHDWTDKYRPIADAARDLKLKGTVIDGEMVLPDERGHPSFGALRSAITSRPDSLIFVAFDLLFHNGEDLRAKPVEERRRRLAGMIQPGGRIQFSEALEGKAADIFRSIDRAGLEGVVSKRKGSPYRSGPTTSWLKAKCYEIGDFDIVGVQRERGKPAMVLMAREGSYVGAAIVATNMEMRERLWARVQERAGAKPPAGLPAGKAEWVKPGLRGRVKFLRGEEMLRHATMQDFEDLG